MFERSGRYRSIVDVIAHNRGIVGENQITIELIDVVNEEALVTNRFEGWPGHCECGSNIIVCGLASRIEVYQPAISIDLRCWISRRQELRLNHSLRDFVAQDLLASFRISLCAYRDMNRWFG